MCLMNRRDFLDRLDVDHNKVFDDHIHSVAKVEFHPAINDWKSDLYSGGLQLQ